MRVDITVKSTLTEIENVSAHPEGKRRDPRQAVRSSGQRRAHAWAGPHDPPGDRGARAPASQRGPLTMKPITKNLARWAQSEFNRRGGKLQAVILDPAYPADGVGTFIVELRKQGDQYIG